METRIVTLPHVLLVGKRLTMSLSKNRTQELWQKFMPFKNAIKNKKNSDLISLQNYNHLFKYEEFTADTEFEKWAAVEVTSLMDVPEHMESFELKGGLYAVFIHTGTPADFPRTLNHIFTDWLPNSKYILDDRPHFEILGERYKNNNPDSEEEVWIPILEK